MNKQIINGQLILIDYQKVNKYQIEYLLDYFTNIILKTQNNIKKILIIQVKMQNKQKEQSNNDDPSISLDQHRKVLDKFKDKQLQYKKKIIELQQQVRYQSNRANDYQKKFQQAVLRFGSQNQQILMQKLNQKQNEINELRGELLSAKKNQASSNYNHQDNNEQIRHLIYQNQQMAKTIEQLKNAAISAIMTKDQQIEDLNQKVKKMEQLEELNNSLIERQESLQRQIQLTRQQSQDELKKINQKLQRERQNFIEKLQEFEKNLIHQQASKEKLLEKTNTLQDNLQNQEKIIQIYQKKISQMEALSNAQIRSISHEISKYEIQVQNYKDQIQGYQKQQKHYIKVIQELKVKQKQYKDLSDKFKDQVAQLNRKLTIKKRKTNPKSSSSQIYSSFEGISQKSSFFSSFIKPIQREDQSKQFNSTDLSQIHQLKDADILQNFIDLQTVQSQKTVQPIKTMKKQPSKSTNAEVTVSHIPAVKKNQNLQTGQKSNQILQKMTKEKQQLQKRNNQIQKQLGQAYSQIQGLNKNIKQMTIELQKQRKANLQIRSQTKVSQKERELIIELQSFKQHVYKLQNALLVQKLQNAQKEEFNKQKFEREKHILQIKLDKANVDLANSSPKKKKKGFFG